jgi:hypothetical protein
VQGPQTDPTTPTTQRCTTVTCDEFGLLPVRSPLLGESRLISSPPGTEMVQFPGCAFRTLWIQIRMSGIWPDGLPHSAIRGSRDVCSSPRLFAAYHGLLRTAAPRHPPWTLSRLTILSFALQSGFLAPRASPQGPLARDCAAAPASALLKLPTHRKHPPSPAPSRQIPTGTLRSRAPRRLSGSSSKHAPLLPSLALSKIR